MDQNMLPPELLSALNGEKKDFAVKADRAVSRANATTLIGMAIFWNGFISIFWIAFFGPLFQGKEVHITVNGTPKVASLHNLEPMIIPAVVIGIFTLIGVALLYGAVNALRQPGPWFAGAETRLIVLAKGLVQSYDWENFTGVTAVRGTNEKAEIMLELRAGHMVSRKNGPSQFVPDKIYMVDIPNAFAIEQMCRKRIKENDPTPPATGVKTA